MGAQERLGAVCVVERMLEATSLGTGDGWPVLAGVARDLAGPDDVALVLGTLVQVSHASPSGWPG